MEDESLEEELLIDTEEMLDEDEEDMASLLKGLQKQLITLEKKVDLLLRRSQEKPMGEAPPRERQFIRRDTGPRPSRPPFERSDRNPRENRSPREGRGPREREAPRSHYYERRPDDKAKGGKPRKKPFYSHYKNRE
jgi:hypothetical protein